MSRKRSEEALNAYGERFVAGAVAAGVERELAERVFEQVRGFSGFGFPKSHAAAFGLLAYQSTWLRVHYGPELLCSLFNEQPMGFYPPDSLAHEAQRRGIEVRPPDVNASGVECSVGDGPGGADRAGLRQRGARRGDARRSWRSVSAAGAYRELGRPGLAVGGERATGSSGSPGRGPARRWVWRRGLRRRRRDRRREPLACGGRQGGEGQARAARPPAPAAGGTALRELDAWERIVADYASTGMSLADHPMGLIRPQLSTGARAVATTARIAGRQSSVELAGMVVARQRPAPPRGSCSCCSRTRSE